MIIRFFAEMISSIDVIFSPGRLSFETEVWRLFLNHQTRAILYNGCLYSATLKLSRTPVEPKTSFTARTLENDTFSI